MSKFAAMIFLLSEDPGTVTFLRTPLLGLGWSASTPWHVAEEECSEDYLKPYSLVTVLGVSGATF